MTPLEPGLIALGWGYALAWMLLLDQVKIWAYAALDRRRESAPLGSASDINPTGAG
jgi:hypothetical protein